MTLRPSHIGAAMLCAVLVALAVSLGGCAGAHDAARATVNGAGIALDETDRAAALHYAAAASRALHAARDMEDYRARMEPWNAVESALRAARDTLARMEEAVDRWEADGMLRWSDLMVEALDAFGAVGHRLEAAGVDIPPSLAEVLQVTRAYVAAFRGTV